MKVRKKEQEGKKINKRASKGVHSETAQTRNREAIEAKKN